MAPLVTLGRTGRGSGRGRFFGCIAIGVLEAAEFKGKDLYLTFEVANPGFEGLVGGVHSIGFLGQLVYRGTGQFRHAANALRRAKLAEVIVFFRGEPEADHFASSIHWLGSSRKAVVEFKASS